MARFAAHIFEIGLGMGEGKAPRLIKADDVARNAFTVAFFAVGDEGCIGLGMFCELPSGRLFRVANRTNIVSREALFTEEHWYSFAGNFGEVHAHKSRVTVITPAAASVDDSPFAIDQADVRNSPRDAIALQNFLAGIREGNEKIEIEIGQSIAHCARSILERDANEGRLAVFRKFFDLVTKESQCVMTVGAGMKEENEHDGTPL